MLNPLQLAFMGDSVHALLVRTRLMEKDLPVKAMHQAATASICAVAQHQALTRIMPFLTPEETDIVRRGRNAHAHHSAPRSASVGQYAGATGLEALLGFLYLVGDRERLEEVFRLTEEVPDAAE